MREYLTNLLPRLKEFSEALNRKEYFVNKTWLLLQEDNTFVEFTFERKYVYKSLAGGQGKQGEWRILPATDQLFLKFSDGESYLLKQIFAATDVMLLSDNSGTNIF
jgi:hypothetical protein